VLLIHFSFSSFSCSALINHHLVHHLISKDQSCLLPPTSHTHSLAIFQLYQLYLSVATIKMYWKLYYNYLTHNVHTITDHNYRTLSATWVCIMQTLPVGLYQELVYILERCLGWSGKPFSWLNSGIIKVFSTTNAQSDNLKNNFKFALKLTLKGSYMFRCDKHHPQGAHHMSLAKVTVVRMS